MRLLVLLASLFGAFAQKFQYESLYEEFPPFRLQNNVLSTLSPVVPGAIPDCAEFCATHDWCIRAYNDSCVFASDRLLLNMRSAYEFTLNEGSLVNLDGVVFVIEAAFGMKSNEHVDTRRIHAWGATMSPAKTNPAYPDLPELASLYGESFASPYPGEYSGHASQWFFDYPMSGIYMLENPLRRLRYTEAIRCSAHRTGAPILPLEALYGSGRFHIINGYTNRFLNCLVEQDDDIQGCSWGQVPTMTWAYDNFGPNGGFALVAFDESSGAYLGHFDRSRCHTTPSSTRLLANGGIKDGESARHCGVGNLRFPTEISVYKSLVFGDNTAHVLGPEAQIVDGGYLSMVMARPVVDRDDTRPYFLQFADGSFVHCDSAGCHASGEMRTVFTFEENYAAGPVEFQRDINVRGSVTVWELNPTKNIFEKRGSLAFMPGDDPFVYVSMSQTTGFLNKNQVLLQDPIVSLIQTLGSRNNKMHLFAGGDDVDPIRVSAFANFTVGGGSSTCPTGHYVHSVYMADPVTPILSCKRADAPCALTGPSVQVNISDGWTVCAKGYVGIGLDSTTLTCQRLDVQPPAPPLLNEPVVPFVGAISLSTSKNDVTFHRSITPETWTGTPLQAIKAVDKTRVQAWEYGKACYTKFGSASFTLLKNQDSVIAVGTETEKAECRSKNQFVTFVQCVEEDCSLGLNITCQDAPFCVIDEKQAFYARICPPGFVVIAVACVNADSPGPCSDLSLSCAPISYDPDAQIEKPENDKTQLYRLLGYLTGFTLVVMGLTVGCIFCGAEDTVPVASVSARMYRF